MKVVQIVESINVEASGPSYSVPQLCDTLARHGAKVALHVLAPAPAKERPYQVWAHPAWRFSRRLGLSPAMKAALRKEAASADIMHSHSLWMMPNVYPAWAVRGQACRLVTSPRGTLAPWSLRQSRWRKRLMWWLAQGRAMRAAHCFHATSEEEYRQIRAVGLHAPVAVIPNGIDLPPDSAPCESGKRRRVLFLSRIHPKKGIGLLLRAWRKVQERYPEWELHIVGPDEGGYQRQMERLGVSLGVERVIFPGPVYGAKKSAAFHAADLFVLPTHAENFGLAVAEALAHGVPAIVSKGAPWEGLETQQCGWWIDQDVDSLRECLQCAMRLSPQKLQEMGVRGRLWMQADYSWDRAGNMMLQTYHWLVGGGTAPSWVFLE